MVESGSFSLTMETFEEWEHSQDDRSYKKSLIAYKNELIEQLKLKIHNASNKEQIDPFKYLEEIRGEVGTEKKNLLTCSIF